MLINKLCFIRRKKITNIVQWIILLLILVVMAPQQLFAMELQKVGAPIVITNLSNSAQFKKGDKVYIHASAQAFVGVSRMEIIINNKTVKTSQGSPISYEWDTSTAAPGINKIKVKAVEMVNNKVGSQSVEVYINDGFPSVKITGPRDYSVFAPGDTVKLSAEASGVACVRFFYFTETHGDNKNIGSKLTKDFIANWKTKGIREGAYIIRAAGYDKNNNQLVSNDIHIRLDSKGSYINAPDIEINSVSEAVYEGDTYNVTATLKREPEALFIQYKDNEGTWYSEEVCKQKYSFDITEKTKLKDGRLMYSTKKTADFPGSPPDFKRQFRLCAVYQDGKTLTSGEESLVVVPERLMPKILGANVTPNRRYQGTNFTFYVQVKGEPESLYLQFDDGEGGWLDEEFSKQYFSFDLSSPKFKSGYSNAYIMEKKINTPGEAPDYARKFRVRADYGDGSKNNFGECYVKVIPR
ncbi:MAG: Ig-like domain-containing protein [Bacillota bacterium]